MKKGGLRLEPIKPKDFSHEKLFGAAPKNEPLIPLKRDISGVPVVCQGNEPFCVAATITWIRQWQSKKRPDLAHEYLAEIAKIGFHGATPSQVLEPARKKGIVPQAFYDKHHKDSFGPSFDEAAKAFKIAGYARVTNLTMQGLYAALKKSPLAIGVRNWQGVGPHFMAAYDVTDDGLALKCVNWWDEKETMIEEVPFKDVVVAYSFLDPEMIPAKTGAIRVGLFGSLYSVATFYKRIIALGGLLVTFIGGALGLNVNSGEYSAFLATDGSHWEVNLETGHIRVPKNVEEGGEVYYGAGYTPVTGYQSNLTDRISTSDTTIPVATINDTAGNPITVANISPSSTVRIYLTLDPGNSSREEIAYCTGASTGQFTGCIRGLNFQGGSISASSTLAKVHPAGARIIMSNVGVFYGEFVSIDGYQEVYGFKYFGTLPRTATGTTPGMSSQLATKGYVDSVGAGGFTASNVSGTLGLIAISSGTPNCDSAAACVGVNASSTASQNGGLLTFVRQLGDATKALLAFDLPSLLGMALTWSGNQIFSGTVTIQNVLGDILKVPSASTSTVTGSVAVNYDTLTQFMATGTAGEALATGEAIYISKNGQFYKTSASSTFSTYPYAGIVQSGAKQGQTFLYVKPGGDARGMTGPFTPGRRYYLGNTRGAVTSTTPESVPAMVGVAVGTTTLRLLEPDFYAVFTNKGTFSSFSLDIGWIPSHVNIVQATGSPIMWSVNNSLSPVLPHPSSTTQGPCAGDTVTTHTSGFAFTAGCPNTGITWTSFAEYRLNGEDLHPADQLH